MNPVIGIDLGTTNSAAAFLGPDGPQIITNALGGRLTPSVVGVDESGAVLVGAAAKELQVLRPERCACLFKRYVGTDRKLTAGGRAFDVWVVELFEGALEVKASSGESALGGEDFTRAVAARVLLGLGVSYEQAEARTPKRVSRLVQQCERAKCALSRDETATVRV